MELSSFLDLYATPFHIDFVDSIPSGQIKVKFESDWYQCHIPSSTLSSQPTKPNISLDTMDCFYFQSSFWSYDICPNDYIRQFVEIDPDSTEEEKEFWGKFDYILATETESISWIETEQGWMMKQVMNQGDPCGDLARTVVLKYSCCDEEHAESVKEESVCQYEIILHSPQFCSIKDHHAAVIHCSKFLT